MSEKMDKDSCVQLTRAVCAGRHETNSNQGTGVALSLNMSKHGKNATSVTLCDIGEQQDAITSQRCACPLTSFQVLRHAR